ncbi:unnamed protein product [Merluccius merluccius]
MVTLSCAWSVVRVRIPSPQPSDGLSFLLTAMGVTTALLLAMCCGGKRMCNYREIHVNRDIVLVQLQSLNLSGSFNVLDEKDHCPSGKAHHVMRSIYGMTQQVRCHRDGKPVRDLDRPVQSMVLLLTDNCRQDLVRPPP